MKPMSTEVQLEIGKIVDPAKKLPDKLGELILVALADAEKVKALPNYDIDMNVWHELAVDGKCRVCLAGCVISQTLGQPLDYKYGSNDYSARVHSKMGALDELRKGRVLSALNCLYPGSYSILDDRFQYHEVVEPHLDRLRDIERVARGQYDIYDSHIGWDTMKWVANNLSKLEL